MSHDPHFISPLLGEFQLDGKHLAGLELNTDFAEVIVANQEFLTSIYQL